MTMERWLRSCVCTLSGIVGQALFGTDQAFMRAMRICSPAKAESFSRSQDFRTQVTPVNTQLAYTS